jgi:hypothetical protein
MGIGWLPASVVDAWRRGHAECLEQLAPVNPDKLAAALQHLRRWAADTGLVPAIHGGWPATVHGLRGT